MNGQDAMSLPVRCLGLAVWCLQMQDLHPRQNSRQEQVGTWTPEEEIDIGHRLLQDGQEGIGRRSVEALSLLNNSKLTPPF